MKYKIFFITLLSAITIAYSEYNQNSLFDALVKKYSNLKTLSASFNDEARGITGIIKAAKGNKYYIKTGTRTIACDGNTVWNYDATTKKVIVNKIESGSSNSIDKIFFNFVENYQPSGLSKNEYGYTLELIKKNSSNPNKDKLILWIDGKTLDIFKIQLNGETSVNTWGLVDLRINKKIRANTFTFDAPQGTEIIDLR